MSIHNIKFLIDFAKKARKAILEDRFEDFYNEHYVKVCSLNLSEDAMSISGESSTT